MLKLVILRLCPLTPIKENSMWGKAKEIYKELNCYTIGMAWIPDLLSSAIKDIPIRWVGSR